MQGEKTQPVSEGTVCGSWKVHVGHVPGIIQVLWTESSETFSVMLIHALIKASHCCFYTAKGERTSHHCFGTQEVPDKSKMMV